MVKAVNIVLHEMQANQEGMEIAIEQGIQKLWIGTDSTCMVSYIQDGARPPWRCLHTLQAIQRMIPKFTEFRIFHNFRQVNHCANSLAGLLTCIGRMIYTLALFLMSCVNIWMMMLGERTFRELDEENQKQDRKTRSISKAEILISRPRDPPLISALKASAAQNAASFHFPGHNRGRAAPPSLTRLIGIAPFVYDLPELPELDNLFSPNGPILESQKQAAQLFGSSETWFLVGGTTCGVQAAIMATCSPGDFLILPRNSHISAISAMVLSGAKPKYIIPEYNSEWDIAGGVTPSQVEKAIKESEMDGYQIAAAVLITCPTYHGICSDLREIAQLCHSYGIPMIVDEAHGAHFAFHSDFPPSALEQGADLAVQSTHKVLCSLTQSSMLHLSGHIIDREKICRCLQLLQSSSPSYLLLASLDAARAQLSAKPKIIFNETMNLSTETRNLIKRIPGISLLKFQNFMNVTSMDPLRLTIGVWKLGLSGYEVDKILFDSYGIIPELVGTHSLTFAINLGTCREHVERLVSGLEHLSANFFEKSKVKEMVEDVETSAPFTDTWIKLNPREAFFASKRTVTVEESLGEICGELICPYPPGIPALFPGEIITEKALHYLLEVRDKGATISGASDPQLFSIVVCKV
ncbi:hypothetical protein GIB67_023070 [Kingdonia uniflora]|uniref:Arginine decarboxylase n=1 Tax=Kingdonia uniflora TaxID=39325 RepID=A0A7J7P883_9MAGN|nr:hypothetical protein GIB67_023070 [Kingdonia uniflora]